MAGTWRGGELFIARLFVATVRVRFGRQVWLVGGASNQRVPEPFAPNY